MRINRLLSLICAVLISHLVFGKEYHVATIGSDANPGTAKAPFKTISKAAAVAMPGDIITVHTGIYREMIVPSRGGTSDKNRIVYRAAPGEKVHIKGSEIITGWTRVKEDLWKVQLSYAFFRKYNPFTDKVYGDWYGGWIHMGEVYLDGKPLSEVETVDKIMNNVPALKKNNPDPSHSLNENYTWFAASDSGETTVYARFGTTDPNTSLVEINVRPACFYPEKNFINYITITGFEMSQRLLVDHSWQTGLYDATSAV